MSQIMQIIFAAALVAVILLLLSLIVAKNIEKKIQQKSEDEFKKTMYYFLDIPYTLFITVVSIFPLLGMLGTVVSLLGLDLSGDCDSIKMNFFQALDTTEWGIIFAVIFKVVNAFFQPFLEMQIEKSKKLLEKSYEE